MASTAAAIDLTAVDDDDDALLDEYDDDGVKVSSAPAGDELDEDEEGDEDETCSICLDPVAIEMQGFLLKCVHCFHFECIAKWAKVTNLCPLCKTRFQCIVQKSASGVVIKKTPVKNIKQVHSADGSQDLVHARNLLAEFACHLCGNGDNEDTLLLCDVDNCENAGHTLCLGLPGVPATSWFCPEHAHRRTAAASRRRATTLATLRTSRAGRARRSTPVRRRITPLEARLGVRRGQRVPLPYEREVAQYAVEPAYHARSVAATEMRRLQQEAAQILQRRQRPVTAPAPAPTTSSLKRKRDTEQMWADSARARQMATLAPTPVVVPTETPVVPAPTAAPRVPFRAAFLALKDAMALAAAKDASTAVYHVPTAAKLRLLPRVKAFFEGLNAAQLRQVLEWHVLSLLKSWLVPYAPGHAQHALVLEGLLQLLPKLPVTKEHLKQSDGLGPVVLQLAKETGPAAALAKTVLDKWKQLVAKPTAPTQVVRPPPPPVVLPPITPMVPRDGKSPTALKKLPFCDAIVAHVKQLVYPQLRDGSLSRDRFTAVVKEAANAFAAEVPFLSGAVVEAGALTPLATTRLGQLVERALR
ncbi:hypothetical protein ACHHYP_15746 [Achlya hypogyna]|uniref:RING-type domain-containing protein n=1 Tax=Achlya hypogyna TaxID=1202772 RepID=A0A1V9YA29_ACHHY|nr:hypothetical protein ACHHYP_15746 [Achlya hypogyna]